MSSGKIGDTGKFTKKLSIDRPGIKDLKSAAFITEDPKKSFIKSNQSS